jgi:signal transduction histidine kinase
MTHLRWQKPKWFPRFLATPVPEPHEHAARILSIQRNIILPTKLVVTVMVLYYLFSRWPDSSSSNWESTSQIVLETLQRFFIFYIIFNAMAAILLVIRRFPKRLVQWLVFIVGFVDGLLLAGLTVETGGFQSSLFWVFPGLIILNAISIPLATPQIVLNLTLSAFYLGAGLVEISVNESGSTMAPATFRHGFNKFSVGDVLNLDALADRIRHPMTNDGVSAFVNTQLAPDTRAILTNYLGGANSHLQRALVEDLNRIISGGQIYNPQRFAGVKLSTEANLLLQQDPQGTNLVRLNRRLLLDAYPLELSKNRMFMKPQPTVLDYFDSPGAEAGAEPFILRLIILWLLTASCFGLQLLLFRQRLAEEEERKSAARNDELKAAGRLAAEIAHQLKNPLGIINNAVFSLQRGLKEGKNNVSHQMEIIREEIERSDRILTQLMGYAQLSEGRVESLHLAEELDRAVAEVFPPAASYSTKIHREYDPKLPVMLMQRAHFSVVLVNLMQNAREAVKGGGNLHVSAHYRDGNSVELAIQDDGPGIAPELHDKIFQAYFTSKLKGTGLGLAIVKHNVELYGGSVWVESELGKGTRFVLLFPAKTFIVTSS